METRTNSLLRSVFIVLFVFYQCFKTSGKQEEQTRTGCRRIKLADGTIVYSKDCKFDGKVVHKVEKCTNPPCSEYKFVSYFQKFRDLIRDMSPDQLLSLFLNSET